MRSRLGAAAGPLLLLLAGCSAGLQGQGSGFFGGAPAAARESRPGYIGTGEANLRPCPAVSRRCEPLATLRLNEEVWVLRRDRGWLFVRVPRLNRKGYVLRTLVSESKRMKTADRSAPRRTSHLEPRSSRPAVRASREGPTPQNASVEPAPEEELIK